MQADDDKGADKDPDGENPWPESQTWAFLKAYIEVGAVGHICTYAQDQVSMQLLGALLPSPLPTLEQKLCLHPSSVPMGLTAIPTTSPSLTSAALLRLWWQALPSHVCLAVQAQSSSCHHLGIT